MQEGIPNGKKIMEKRLLQERKNELEKILKKDKNFRIVVTTKFEGNFDRFVEEAGETYAVFVQPGRTDRGSIPERKVMVKNIVSTELVKT